MADQRTDRDDRMRMREARKQEQERLQERQNQRDRLRQDLAEIENQRQILLSQRRNQQRRFEMIHSCDRIYDVERPDRAAERLNTSSPELPLATGTSQILGTDILHPHSTKQHNQDLGSYMGYMSPEPGNIPTAISNIGISGSLYERNDEMSQAIAQTDQSSNRNLGFDTGNSRNMSQDLQRIHSDIHLVRDRDDIHESFRREISQIDQPRQDSSLHLHSDRHGYRATENDQYDISSQTRSHVNERYHTDTESHNLRTRDRNVDKVNVSIETDKLEEKLRQLSMKKDTNLDISSLHRSKEHLDYRREDRYIPLLGMDPEIKDSVPQQTVVERKSRNNIEFIDRKFKESSYIQQPDINVRGELNEDNPDTGTRDIKYEKYSLLQQIDKKKMELQELLLLQENTEKQLQLDEERRIVELEKQKMMLDKLIEREKVIDDREQKLKEEENDLLLRYEKLKRIKQDVVKSEEEQFVQLKTRERDIVSKSEELRKRETDLRKKEEILTELQHKLVPEVKTETIVQQTPEISPFSGEEVKPKNEVTLNEWKSEIRSLIATTLYPEKMIAQAIRKSLKGQAKKVLLNLDPNAKAEDIIERTEDIFGDMSSKQTIFTEFYTAAQKPNESIADWGLRLEEILIKASTKKSITPDERNEMLKDKFWRSLYSKDIKNAVRTSFESTDSFEMLRRKARAEEHETKISTVKADIATPKQEDTAKAADKQTELLETMMKQMAELNKKVDDYRKETERKPQDENRYRRYGGYNRWNGQRDYNGGAYNCRNRFDNRNHRPKWQNPDSDKKQEEKKEENKDKVEKKPESEKGLN